ncbi:MAG: phosphopantetheine-binding protein [Deltaproteobacteria bacterium]|jgi:3-oxoacyl-(acyl-carrier-protein) synthase/acyl carrier protein|nr:phosphopantetheine-binding protein [Deltaproteobacteria bacterium]
MSAPFFSKFNLTPEEKDATIAVIGLGTLFPGRPGVAGFWSVIKNGLDTMSDIPLEHFNAADYYDPDPKARDKIYTKRGAFISKVPFEPLRYGISPKDIDSIDTTQLLGLLVADAALTDAGYPVDKSDHSRTAVIVGVTGALKMTVTLGSRLAHPQLKKALLESGVDDNTAREVLERFANQFTPWRELSFPGLLGNVTAGRIASRLNLGGANMVVDAACASSLAAVSQAILELRAKRADLVVSGGMDTFNDPFMFTCFSKTPALSRTGEVKSFDEAGDGTMLGEGLGVVILQRLADAERDNNRIYAVIRGVGAASDGRGTAIFAPSAQGQKRALEAAFKEAGFGADTIELVEAHGTGTAVGDAIELSALSSLFGENKLGYPWCALGSVKSQIGHTKAAAGIAGLIKVVLSLHHKVLPPTIKVKNPLAPLKEENCPFYLNTEARPWFARGQHPRRAVVSAFGFGGANYHAILEEAGEIKIPFETGVHLLPFSASRLESIVQDIRDLAQDAWLSVPQESLGQERVAQDYFSQAVDYHFRSHPSFDKDAPEKLFLAFPAQRARDFLNTLVDQLSAHFQNRDMVSLPDGIFFGRNKEEELVYYIPGSFSLEPGTAKELALNFSHFQMILDLFSEGYEGTPLGLLLYPPELSLNSLKEKWLSELHSPLGSYFLKTALSIALYELYSFFGITSKRTMGRGPGLLAALVIAGYLPLKEVIIALGKLAPSDIEGLKEALNSLPIEDPPPGKPQLVNTNGEPWESLALIKSALMADFEELLNNPEAFLQASPDGLASGLIIYAGSPVSLEAGELSLNSKVRVLPAPKGTLDFAKNLAYLASIGQPVAFRNWSYFTFPPPKPDGHHVLLSGANTYTPEPSPQVRVHKATEVSGELEKRVDRLAKAQEESLEEMRAIREFLTENLSFAPGAQGERPLGGPGKKTIKASFLSSFSELRARVPGGNGSGAQKKPSLAGDPQGLDSIKAPFDPLSSQGAFHVLAEIVAKETGYPPESLNPSLDLESDLGLDSIKKVELFSEIAHHFPDMAISNFSSSRTLGDLAGKLISPPQHLTSNSFNDYSSQNPLETKAPGSHSVLGRGQKASQTSFSGFY